MGAVGRPLGADAVVLPPPARARRARAALRLAWLRARARGRLRAAAGVRVGRRVRVTVARGARVELGAGCALADGVRIDAVGGEVRIGPGATVGEDCVLVALRSVEVGAEAVLGPAVLLADAEASFGDPERPIRAQPVRRAAVRVGPRARLGAHAAVLAGCEVGAGAVVGSYAVVTQDVPPGGAVAGVPARAAGQTRSSTASP